MEYRSSFEGAFGRIKYDLYNKRIEVEKEIVTQNRRTNIFYRYLEKY